MKYLEIQFWKTLEIFTNMRLDEGVSNREEDRVPWDTRTLVGKGKKSYQRKGDRGITTSEIGGTFCVLSFVFMALGKDYSYHFSVRILKTI